MTLKQKENYENNEQISHDSKSTTSVDNFAATSHRKVQSSAQSQEFTKKTKIQQNQSSSFSSQINQQINQQQYQQQTSVLTNELNQININDLKPKILASMPDKRVDLDGKAVFSCEYSSLPSEKTQINWYHNSILITKSENQQKYVIRNDNNRSILFILNVNYEDSGVYEIRIINKHGFVSQSARLFVSSGKLIKQFSGFFYVF